MPVSRPGLCHCHEAGDGLTSVCPLSLSPSNQASISSIAILNNVFGCDRHPSSTSSNSCLNMVQSLLSRSTTTSTVQESLRLCPYPFNTAGNRLRSALFAGSEWLRRPFGIRPIPWYRCTFQEWVCPLGPRLFSSRISSAIEPDLSSTRTSKCTGLFRIKVITVPQAPKRQPFGHH